MTLTPKRQAVIDGLRSAMEAEWGFIEHLLIRLKGIS